MESLDINVKTHSLVGIKEKAISEEPLERTESSLQVGSKRSTDSGKSSGRPGGSPNLSPSPEANIGVFRWREKQKSKDIFTESSNMSSHTDHVSYTSAPQEREGFGLTRFFDPTLPGGLLIQAQPEMPSSKVHGLKSALFFKK
jgi:hypothetical protein